MQTVVGVAVVRDGLVLAAYRVGGGWEFPGGKVEPGETDEQAAVREIREELDLEIKVGDSLGPGVDISPDYRLHVYLATAVAGDPVLRKHLLGARPMSAQLPPVAGLALAAPLRPSAFGGSTHQGGGWPPWFRVANPSWDGLTHRMRWVG